MTTRKTIGYLTLKDLPGVPAFTISTDEDYGDWAFGGVRHTAGSHPDFFLPIYEGEKVCPDCKGHGTVDRVVSQHVVSECICHICGGARKVTDTPAPKEKTIQWPPVAGQMIWRIKGNGHVSSILIYAIIPQTVCFKFEDVTEQACTMIEARYIDCFPTRELAEEYLQWRKDRGI